MSKVIISQVSVDESLRDILGSITLLSWLSLGLWLLVIEASLSMILMSIVLMSIILIMIVVIWLIESVLPDSLILAVENLTVLYKMLNLWLCFALVLWKLGLASIGWASNTFQRWLIPFEVNSAVAFTFSRRSQGAGVIWTCSTSLCIPVVELPRGTNTFSRLKNQDNWISCSGVNFGNLKVHC